VHYGLPDIEDSHILLGKNAGQRRCLPRSIVP
jgi:hypothetical protein